VTHVADVQVRQILDIGLEEGEQTLFKLCTVHLVASEVEKLQFVVIAEHLHELLKSDWGEVQVGEVQMRKALISSCTGWGVSDGLDVLAELAVNCFVVTYAFSITLPYFEVGEGEL